MKNFSKGMWNICLSILFLLCLFIALFLGYYGVKFSFYCTTDYWLPIQIVHGKPILDIFLFLGLTLLIIPLEKSYRNFSALRRLQFDRYFVGICCILFVAAAWIWTASVPYYPSGDQLIASSAAYYNLQGNFEMFRTDGYVGIYSQQKGFIFLYEILFSLFGDFCYPIVEKIHILLGALTLLFGYLFLEEHGVHFVSKHLYCIAFLLCAPYLILLPYIYGDLPSVCFCMILFRALGRYFKTSRTRHLILACLMAILATMERTNTWIVLIAIAIAMFLSALQKKSFRPILVTGILFLTVTCSLKTLDWSYEKRSGYPNTHGAPAILWIAMGLQDNWNGPGVFNDYQQRVLNSVDFDRAAAAQIGQEYTSERIRYFLENPKSAISFFKLKLQMQWIEPLFETLKSTYSFPEGTVLTGWIFEVYHGKYHNPLSEFADRYQSIVYLGFLAFVLLHILRNKSETAIYYIPLIAIVGGFLFSVIWEAQCRYVLPYYLFMLLYASEGICKLANLAEMFARKIRVKIRSRLK